MRELIVRHAVPDDAQSFLHLWVALDSETEFMLFEPGERQTTLAEQRSRLEHAESSDNVGIFVAIEPQKPDLAGFVAGRRSNNLRDKHTLHIVIGIRQSYTGKGLGLRLLAEIEQWALSIDIKRLELDVLTNNINAVKLYERHGFEIEGTKKQSVSLRSGMQDEYVMGKLL